MLNINLKISDIFYNKKEFGVNKISMTIGLVFQDNQRTLLDTEVSEEISKIISYLQDKFNAVVRK
jgi:phenylalanyl-tRNA synthetase beta subunit